MNVLRRGAFRLAVCATLVVSLGAAAQTYPPRPVRLIVADAPGGAPDQLAHLLTEKLFGALGQQVVVDNRPGAGGVLGARGQAAPDGYTLLMTTTAIYAVLPNLRKNLTYDPGEGFRSHRANRDRVERARREQRAVREGRRRARQA
jgi:tripartite-type tricarboxylate transporter receptor subunit TctC